MIMPALSPVYNTEKLHGDGPGDEAMIVPGLNRDEVMIIYLGS